jgi:hypothetical protein
VENTLGNSTIVLISAVESFIVLPRDVKEIILFPKLSLDDKLGRETEGQCHKTFFCHNLPHSAVKIVAWKL